MVVIMQLKPGFNIVENEYESFDTMTILELLRRIYRNESIPRRVTVRGLDILLSNSYEQEEMVHFISSFLREGQNQGLIRPTTTIQFVINGNISKDIHTCIKVRNEYISLENLFYGGLTRQAPDWVHAVR